MKKFINGVWHPYIDKKLCIKCKNCVEFCFRNVYSVVDDNVIVKNPTQCINGCHGCEPVCPVEAISFPIPFSRDYALKIIKKYRENNRQLSESFIKFVTSKKLVSEEECKIGSHFNSRSNVKN